MNFKYKKIEELPINRYKKPICYGKKDAIVRICTNRDCKNTENQILCSISTCECNTKVHNKCYQFINYECLNNLMEQFSNKCFQNIFKDILQTLETIAKDTIHKYNQILDNYQTYYLPKPLFQIKIGLNKQGVIKKKDSLELREFFQKFDSYFIPNLKQINETNQSIKQIQEICNNFLKSSKEFSVNINKKLVQHQNKAKQIINQKNDQYLKMLKNKQKQKNKNEQKSKSAQKR